jgi:lipid-A-disaccharide synthase
VDISNILPKDKKIISIFPGSRISEIDLLLPILVDFMKLMNKKYNNFYFVIHSTELMRNIILEKLSNFKDDNYQIVTNPNIKEDIIKHSFFAVSKSGTISLEISKYEVPSIIIYKMNPINFFFIKRMVKTKFANIINIINQKEIIPELLQSECNSKEIFNSVNYFIQKPEMIKKQQKLVKKTVKSMQNDELSSLNAANIVLNYIKN